MCWRWFPKVSAEMDQKVYPCGRIDISASPPAFFEAPVTLSARQTLYLSNPSCLDITLHSSHISAAQASGSLCRTSRGVSLFQGQGVFKYVQKGAKVRTAEGSAVLEREFKTASVCFAVAPLRCLIIGMRSFKRFCRGEQSDLKKHSDDRRVRPPEP